MKMISAEDVYRDVLEKTRTDALNRLEDAGDNYCFCAVLEICEFLLNHMEIAPRELATMIPGGSFSGNDEIVEAQADEIVYGLDRFHQALFRQEA